MSVDTTEATMEATAPAVEVTVVAKKKKARPKKKSQAKRVQAALKQARKDLIRAGKKSSKKTKKVAKKAISKTNHTVRQTGAAVGHTARKGGRRVKSGAVFVYVTGLNWLRRLGHRLYWSGTYVGRSIGRAMRFFGRSARTSFVGTSRFLGNILKSSGTILKRGSGWTLRGISWMFKSVLESTFQVTAVAFLATALLLWLLARTTDGYATHIHDRTVAMSKGTAYEKVKHHKHAKKATKTEARAEGERQPFIVTLPSGQIMIDPSKVDPEDVQWGSLPLGVQQQLITYYNEENRRLRGDVDKLSPSKPRSLDDEPDEPRLETWLSEPEQRKRFEEGWKVYGDINKFALWSNPKQDLGIPEEYYFQEHQQEFLMHMLEVHTTPEFQEWREAHEIDMSDNDFFKAMSYWIGRYNADVELFQALLDMSDNWAGFRDGTWEDFTKELKVHYNARKALLMKAWKEDFDNRGLHRASVNNAFTHQWAWMEPRFKAQWDLGLFRDWGPDGTRNWHPEPGDTTSYRTPAERAEIKVPEKGKSKKSELASV